MITKVPFDGAYSQIKSGGSLDFKGEFEVNS